MFGIIVTIALLAFVFIGLFSGKVKFGAMGATIVAVLMATGVLTPAEALSGFSNTNIAIMVAMMVVGAGLTKTSIVSKILGLMDKLGKGEFGILVGFALITILLSQFMNGFVTLTLLVPFITAVCAERNVSSSKVVFPVFVLSMGWVSTLPIGKGASVFAQYNNTLEAFGSAYRFGMLDVFIARAPVAIVATIVAIFVLPRLVGNKNGSSALSNAAPSAAPQKKSEPLSKAKETLAYIIVFGTIILMLLSGTLGYAIYIPPICGAVLMVLCGILTEAEAFKSISFSFVFFLAGQLVLGTALTNTGASDLIASIIIKLMGGSTNPWVINTIFTLIGFIGTQLLSNTAVLSVLTPLAIMVCVKLNLNPLGIVTLINIACTSSFMLPTANPGVPVAMEAGGYDVRDTFKLGAISGLAMCIAGIVWCTLYFN